MEKRWRLCAFLVAMAAGVAHLSIHHAQMQATSCHVTTISGDVRGVDLGSSCAFLGIPFAAPPVGSLRWKPPQPAAAWAPATLMATAAPPSCALIFPPGSSVTQGNEDCLKLNIWTPGQQEFAESPRAAWSPVVDGLDIPDQPRTLYEAGAFNLVPVIVGATRDDGWVYVDRSFPGGLSAEQYEAAVATEFGEADAQAILAMYPVTAFPSPKHALSQLTGDFEAACEARRVARLIQRRRTPVYLYSFAREVNAVAGDQVIHGLDTNFVFGNNFGPPTPYVLTADDLSLSGAISGYWTRFAATGNPNTDDESVVHWPAFKHPSGQGRGADKYLVLDWPVREDMRPREAQCDFWEPFFLRSITAGPAPAWRP